MAQSKQQAKTAAEKAQNVFFEKIPDFKSIKIPDRKNFVKLDNSVNDDFNKVPLMNETLRHVIPPEVRSMQSELKTFIQNLIDQSFKNIEKQEFEERSFLGQYQLP